MKIVFSFLLSSSVLLGLRTASGAEPKLTNSYMDIPRNNPFRLVTPIMLPPAIEPEPPRKLKIRLVGISTVGGRSCALLEVQQIQFGIVSRPILHEKEQFADMQMVEINPEEGGILLKIGPKTEKLLISSTFDKDSSALSPRITPIKSRK